MNPRHWLITSFSPFAGRAENNSQNVLKELMKLAQAHESPTIQKVRKEMGEKLWPFQFHSFTLPTEYDRCFNVLADEIARLKSEGIKIDGVLTLGEGKSDLKIEVRANNLDDSPDILDNVGVRRVAQKIYPKLPETIPLYFPFDEVFGGFYAEFLEFVKSPSPGNFVCNNLCMHATVQFEKLPKTERPYFGFVHVPRADQRALFSAQKCAQVIFGCFETLRKRYE